MLLIHSSVSEFNLPKFKQKLLDYLGAAEEQYIHWNDIPNVTEVDEQTFWRFKSQLPFFVEILAPLQKVDKELSSVFVYLVDNGELIKGGFVVVVRTRDSRVSYFTWTQCNHTFTNKGNKFQCTKCGGAYEFFRDI
jgi:hypothetical protein